MDLVRISATEAKERVEREGYVIVDVRSTPEFAEGHPAGAYNIPLLHKQPQGMVSNPDFAKVVEAAFPDRGAKLITTCAMGGRSSRAAQTLLAMGYTQVVDLRGGFDGERDDDGAVVFPGWRGRQLPIETGESAGRSYVELYARVGAPKSVPPAAPPASAASHGPAHGGHGHAHGGHGHAHGDHGHAHGDHGAPAPAAALNRFADPARLVDCAKLGRRLPGLKRKPLGGALGDRVFASISAEAWSLWAEHSKLLINEYRLNPADAPAQKMLLEQCEAFLFGGGAAERPKEYRPT